MVKVGTTLVIRLTSRQLPTGIVRGRLGRLRLLILAAGEGAVLAVVADRAVGGSNHRSTHKLLKS